MSYNRRETPVIIGPVSLQVAGHQTIGYRIATEVYEGPLDLLLELIDRAELDITKLALAQVTDQFLAYLRELQERNAAEVSAFLVIAARLLQIKSAALLPRPTIDKILGDEEDPGEALARQLILYKRFKELSGELARREEAGMRTYLRLVPASRFYTAAKFDLSEITLPDLVLAARDIFFSKKLPELSQVVNMPRITIREKIKLLIQTLSSSSKVGFRSLFQPRANRVEIVVTFLAMLELVKRHIVEARQETLFGDIEIETQSELAGLEEINIEFEDSGA